MVGAGEDRGVALIVSADLHPAVPAGVQDHVDPLPLIAGEDDRLLAHAGDEVVAGPGDLALVADEEPGAGEDALLLLREDFVVDEELAAHDSALHVDQRARIPPAGSGHRHVLHPMSRGATASPGCPERRGGLGGPWLGPHPIKRKYSRSSPAARSGRG